MSSLGGAECCRCLGPEMDRSAGLQEKGGGLGNDTGLDGFSGAYKGVDVNAGLENGFCPIPTYKPSICGIEVSKQNEHRGRP